MFKLSDFNERTQTDIKRQLAADLRPVSPAVAQCDGRQPAPRPVAPQASPMKKPWTEAEETALRSICAGDAAYSLDELSARLNRSRASVALKISRMGLGNHERKASDSTKAKLSNQRKGKQPAFDLAAHMAGKPNPFKGKKHTKSARLAISEANKAHIASHGHPKHMLGKHHTEATKQAISAKNSGSTVPTERRIRTVKTRVAKYGPQWSVRPVSWKQGWREIGGQRIFARSRWEANYARYLEFLRANGELTAWQHEGETFWFNKIKRGTVSYMPDFKITNKDGSVEYHEVKGWMDDRSKTKLKRMAKYHPTVKIRLIDKHWFKHNSGKLSALLPGWETCRA